MQIDFANLDRLTITACGTAYLAGLTAKYWFERYARLPIEVDIASEFRYRETPIPKTRGALHLAIGRDRRYAGGAALLQGAGAATIGAVVNVPNSTIAREADAAIPILCRP